LPGLIQSFMFASKVLEDTVAHALTLLQENKTISGLVARGRALSGEGSAHRQSGDPTKGAPRGTSHRERYSAIGTSAGHAEIHDLQSSSASGSSAKGVASAAVMAVGGAAATAGGIVCDVVERGRQTWRSSGTAGYSGFWSRLSR
jgi:hypothetical protein